MKKPKSPAISDNRAFFRKEGPKKMLQFYNTLSNQKEVFKPLNEGRVTMYVCGPTVYNYIHIGNARSAVAFDTVRRYLEYRGFEVNYVSNFTDVDDKIIRVSQESGLSVQAVTDKYIAAFYEDITALNVKKATLNPRVMDNMADIIAFVGELIEKGYAYEAQGDVYYRARKFTDYGKLSGQAVDDLELGASQRVDNLDQGKKEDPLDFALWKKAKENEISWDSPWGAGRPGWHIECSVMSTKYLGDTIDIHAGGQDLEFPHHENEIAQSEAKTGKKFANYWLHNGFVTVGEQDEKMSKSLGNFVTVHDLVRQEDPQVIRFLMATTQYRRPIRYSQTSLAEARTNLDKLRNAIDNLRFRQVDALEQVLSAEVSQKVTDFKQAYIEAMDDDINVQNGLAVIYELAKFMNIYSEQAQVSLADLQLLETAFLEMTAVLGLEFTTQAGDDDAKIDQMVKDRDLARKNKDFQTSDALRDELQAMGIILEDTPQGTRWKRK